MNRGTALLASASIAISGCAAMVDRTTPSSLRANPGSVIDFSTAAAFETAYERVKEQMIVCYQAHLGGPLSSVQWQIQSDRTQTDGRISWISSSAQFGTKTYITMTITAVPNGTHITTYMAYLNPTMPWREMLRAWIEEGSERCDGS